MKTAPRWTWDRAAGLVFPVAGHQSGRNRLAIYAAGIAAIALTVVTWTLLDARQAARSQAGEHLANIATALESDLTRMIGTLDLSLQAAVSGMKIPGLSDMDESLRNAILFDGAVAAEEFGGVIIVDAAGQRLYGSANTAEPPADISRTAFFQRHRDGIATGLDISGPQQSAPQLSAIDGTSNLLLTRRLNDAEGNFAGVAIARLHMTYIRKLFDELGLAEGSRVLLMRSDGTIIESSPPTGDPAASVTDAAMPGDAGDGTSLVERTSGIDGVRRLCAVRRLNGLPLAIGVGFTTRQIYADWTVKSVILVGVVAVLLVLGALLAWALSRALRQRVTAEQQACRVAAEHAIARARLDALFANSPDSMAVAHPDANGDFVYEAVNPVWERLAGVPAHAALRRTPDGCLPPKLAALVMQDWQRCITEQRVVDRTLSSGDVEVSGVWQGSITPVLDAQGATSRLFAVTRDITEPTRLEAALREAQRVQAVGQLTAGVAHDFNNLLMAIQGALSVLREHPGLDADGIEAANLAQEAAARGATLVDRLLAFSRKQTLAPSALRPADVLAESAGLLARTLGQGIRTQVLAAADLWTIGADHAQLQDCLLNLALNARDAMGYGGELRLMAFNATPRSVSDISLPPGDYVCFAVADEGSGMTADTLKHALDPFFTTKAAGKGAGLGLSMVQGFARQSGGEVELRTVPGEGTTVTLWLPRLAGQTLPPAAAPQKMPSEPSPPSCTEPSHSKGRVLLVDDEPTVRRAIAVILRRAGFTPTEAATGEEALALLQNGIPCDLLLTDQTMPGMSGAQLIAAVETLRPDLPALLITGYDRASGLEQLGREIIVLRKPFERAVLLQHVTRLIAVTTPV